MLIKFKKKRSLMTLSVTVAEWKQVAQLRVFKKTTTHYTSSLYQDQTSYMLRNIFTANTRNRIWNKHWYCDLKVLNGLVTKFSKYLKPVALLRKVPPTRSHLYVIGRRGEAIPGTSYYQCGLLLSCLVPFLASLYNPHVTFS